MKREVWTDYLFKELGDTPGTLAPIRRVEVRAYDGNKYAIIEAEGMLLEVKVGYLYTRPGRCGEVPCLSMDSY